ncbi:MAG: phosphotransferase [Pseudobutyrivibrio sp.]|nr:phosphotransferase [Pseudobutyrivibrio sp.]
MEKDLLLDRFVGFHKQLMQYHTDEAISYKDFLSMLSPDDETNSKINALEDGNYFIHGDFHLNNVLVDDNNDFALIDMMNVCKGTKLYDVARTYFLLSYDKSIQAKYLEKMGCSVQDIRPYLDVIQAVRAKELNI